MSAFTGEHSSEQVPRESSRTLCRRWRPPKLEKANAVKANCVVAKRPSFNAGWPAEAETSWVTEHKDDPDEEKPAVRRRNCGGTWTVL